MKNLVSKFLFPLSQLVMIMIMVLLFRNYGTAQVSTNYTFSSTVNTSLYSALQITGGHQVGGNLDDDNYYLDSIGFNFYYNGATYSQLWIDANGYIMLGASPSPGTYYGGYYGGPPLASGPNTISPFCYDLMGDSLPTSEMRIQTIGTAPNRTCVIQWRDWGAYGASGVTAPTTAELYNFQIRLIENNGNGMVQFVYGKFLSTSSYFTSSAPLPAQVGINGSIITDYNCRTGSSGWASTSAGASNTANISFYSSNMPDSGRTFTWTPPIIPMTIDSVTTIQVTGGVSPGSTSVPIIGVVAYTHGNSGVKIATQINASTSGTSHVSDIVNAKVYYTGNTPNMSGVINQFGSTITSPGGTLNFTGVDTLKQGANYFWITYDIISGSTPLGDSLDAQCTNLTDSIGHLHTPNVVSPPGLRLIVLPLNGSYTINSSLPSSSTNFQSFNAAISALSINGISGPVTFTVAAGTYNEQVSIPAGIIGSSSTNRITFDGGTGNATTRILSFSIASSSVLTFNQCNYVSFRNITISNTVANTCQAVAFVGNISTTLGSSNSVINCIISTPNAGTNTSYGIASGTTNFGAALNFCDSLTIDSNTITGSYYGIDLWGGATAQLTSQPQYNRGFRIRYNTILGGTYCYYGIYIYFIQSAIDILNNTIDLSSSSNGYYGIYLYYNTNHYGSSSTRINNNKLAGIYYNYIYYSSASAAYPIQIINNMMYNTRASTNYFFYLYNSTAYGSYYNVYHNSVNLSNGTGTIYGVYYYNTASGGINVKNNIFTANNTAAYPGGYYNTNPVGDVINYNVYYNVPGGNILYRGSSYTTANYSGAAVGGDTSYLLSPRFVNPSSNLHLIDACSVPRGATYLGVTSDIDGITRPAIPMIGASEPSYLSLDLAMDTMRSPAPPIVVGSNTVTVRIRNVGSTAITSATLAYKLNSNSAVTQAWSGYLNPCDTALVSFAVPITLVSVNTIKVYTASPNGSADGNRNNDTLTFTYMTPLSGTFTINGLAPTAGTNFNKFSDAIATLVNSGLSGPVVFNVAAGTYNEQPNIPSTTINGLSAVNTVTFDGGNGNASTRIITNASSNAVFQVNNQKYIAIRNLTITNTSPGPGISIIGTSLTNNGTGCSIVGCIINVPIQTGTSSTGYSLTVTGTAGGAGGSAQGADSITIDSNTITGGAYGLLFYGQTNASYNRFIRIRYNTVNNCNYMGTQIYYIYNPVDFLNNTINMQSSYGYYGIYFYGNLNTSTTTSTRIMNNKLFNFGGYGLYLYNDGGTATAPIKVYNNLIINNATSYGGYYGLYNSATSYGEYYHNTIIMGFAGTSTSYTCFINYTANSWIKNNIFGVLNGSTSPVYMSTSPTGDQLNYNIYYNLSGSTTLGYRGGFFTTANYLSPSYGGDTSYNYTPNYTNAAAGNYSLTSACGASGVDLISPGTSYTVGHDSIDITGITRTVPPTIGAYQFNGVSNDLAVVSIMSPVYPVTAGIQNVKVKITNTGTTTIYSTTMKLSLNGGTPVTVAYSSAGLNPCAYDSVTFSSINILTGLNTVKVYSSLPNTTTDGNRNNDTINVIVGTPMSGTYTINPVLPVSSSNYQSFEGAISDIGVRGVAGPVTFNVATGSYSPVGGTLTLGNYTAMGASATNTITFKSNANNPDSVTVNGIGAGYVLVLSNASYINIKSIKFVQPTAPANGIQMTGAPVNDTIYNCKFIIPQTTSTCYSLNTAGISMNGVCFRKNLFQGGYYGLYFYTTTLWSNNVTIDSNTVSQMAYYPLYYLYYQTNVKFKYNTINIADGPTTYGYVYYCEYLDSASDISYNNIILPNAGTYSYLYGFGAYYCVGNAVNHVKWHHNRIDAVGSGSYFYNYYVGYYSTYMDIYNNYINAGGSGYGAYYLGYYSNNIRFYNNTILNGSYPMYYYSSGATNVDLKNNIFINNAGGYAFYNAGSALGATETMDYNLYYSTSSTPMYSTSAYSLPAWKTANAATMRDHNSLLYWPGLTNVTSGTVNLAPNMTDSSIWAAKGRGMPVSWITDDFTGNARSTSVATGPTCIGAYEFSPATFNANGTLTSGVLPPLCTITPSATPAMYSTQYFLFGGDTMASLYWVGATPTTVGLRVFPGYNPPQIGTAVSTSQYTKAYWNFTSSSGSFLYNVGLHFKDNWLGTVPSKANIIGASKYPGQSWLANIWYSCTVDTIMDTIGNSYLTPMTNAYFCGTTAITPCPIQMDKFNAVRSGMSGLLSWSTASELNSDHFEIERSIDGINFRRIAIVKAIGNTSSVTSYGYTDVNVIADNSTAKAIYYRLRMVDQDGTNSLSPVVSITLNNVTSGLNVFPNPFKNELNVNITLAKESNAKISIMDISGKVVVETSATVQKGTSALIIPEAANLHNGIYFLRVETSDETRVVKLIKE